MSVSLRHIGRIDVHVQPPLALGELAGAERRIIPIDGGTLMLSGLSGTVLPGGADIQAVRPDGTIELTARYAIDLGKTGKLLVENTGIRRPGAGPSDLPYFRGVVRFTAPPGALQWLNDSVFVNSGRREGDTVILDLFEVC